ncbi:TraR/DksA family transcriptional regulator [Billgrantia azerbaijanica]|nr:TraR/DksA family transcriptional regulator [Halomonas azerbaijanica]
MDNADRAQELIDERLEQAMAARRAAGQRVPLQGRAICEDCEDPIPAERRARLPGVRTCVQCQADREKRQRGRG